MVKNSNGRKRWFKVKVKARRSVYEYGYSRKSGKIIFRTPALFVNP